MPIAACRSDVTLNQVHLQVLQQVKSVDYLPSRRVVTFLLSIVDLIYLAIILRNFVIVALLQQIMLPNLSYSFHQPH